MRVAVAVVVPNGRPPSYHASVFSCFQFPQSTNGSRKIQFTRATTILVNFFYARAATEGVLVASKESSIR